MLEPGSDPRVRKHRTVLADEGGAVLAVAAEPDGALHVALHGEVDVGIVDAAPLQRLDRVAHHDLRPAEHGGGVERVEAHPLQETGHDAHVAAPPGSRAVHRHVHLHRRPPALQVGAVENVLRRAGPVQQGDAAVVRPIACDLAQRGTQRRQAEEEVRSALARERELSELKSRFVAVASHEFRTPLAAILSSIELLDDYGTRLPDDERREIVGLIKSAVARMNGMVEQVLLTSRLEAGKFVFEPSALAVPQLLVQVAAELDQANPQAARVAMHCEGLDQPRRIDARLLRHILVNLLGNALKYSAPETPVTCSALADGDELCLSVSDRGIGIPAADLPRLFETFHRGGNVGNIQGTGMGLHIVRECVQLHRGTIAVESEPGQGTTFRVRLHAPAAA